MTKFQHVVRVQCNDRETITDWLCRHYGERAYIYNDGLWWECLVGQNAQGTLYDVCFADARAAMHFKLAFA